MTTPTSEIVRRLRERTAEGTTAEKIVEDLFLPVSTVEYFADGDPYDFLCAYADLIGDAAFMLGKQARRLEALEEENKRLRKALNEACETLDSIATEPADLNDGYDHYKASRVVARLASKSARAALSHKGE